MDEKQNKEKWTGITRGNKITKKVAPYYVHLSHALAKLSEFSADQGPPPLDYNNKTSNQNKHQSNFKFKKSRRRQAKFKKYMAKTKDKEIIDLYITKVKDERTAKAKQDF